MAGRGQSASFCLCMVTVFFKPRGGFEGMLIFETRACVDLELGTAVIECGTNKNVLSVTRESWLVILPILPLGQHPIMFRRTFQAVDGTCHLLTWKVVASTGLGLWLHVGPQGCL